MAPPFTTFLRFIILSVRQGMKKKPAGTGRPPFASYGGALEMSRISHPVRAPTSAGNFFSDSWYAEVNASVIDMPILFFPHLFFFSSFPPFLQDPDRPTAFQDPRSVLRTLP